MKCFNLKIVGIIILIISGCLEGGTHGYIKRYRYKVPKKELEKVVHQVLLISPSILQDSVKGYYNDDTRYVTLTIKYNSLPYEYIFHFYGGKQYWDTSRTSAISISYAYDEMRNGGDEHGGIDEKLKERLVAPFEREFVSKIDSILGMMHAEE